MKQGEDLDIILNINSKSGDITMKIKLYPKELLEAAWKQDKKLYAHGDAAAPPNACGVALLWQPT